MVMMCFCQIICCQAIPFLYDQKLKRTTFPSLRRSSVCIIISPLISLMVDQVAQLRSLGVVCAILSGSSGVAKSLRFCRRRKVGWV